MGHNHVAWKHKQESEFWGYLESQIPQDVVSDYLQLFGLLLSPLPSLCSPSGGCISRLFSCRHPAVITEHCFI